MDSSNRIIDKCTEALLAASPYAGEDAATKMAEDAILFAAQIAAKAAWFDNSSETAAVKHIAWFKQRFRRHISQQYRFVTLANDNSLVKKCTTKTGRKPKLGICHAARRRDSDQHS